MKNSNQYGCSKCKNIHNCSDWLDGNCVPGFEPIDHKNKKRDATTKVLWDPVARAQCLRQWMKEEINGKKNGS